MQQPRPLYIANDQPGAKRICRDCGYFVFGRHNQDGKTCGHPSNTTPDIDIITGDKDYYLTAREMREEPEACGIEGKLWVKYSTLYAATYPPQQQAAIKPAIRNRTVSLDDI